MIDVGIEVGINNTINYSDNKLFLKLLLLFYVINNCS